MKRSTTSILTAALAATALTLSACSSDSKAAGADAAAEKQDAVEIGITQIVSHTSLDAAREGFKKALAENGYVEGENVTYDEQNAQGDQATATSIANKFASDGKDLVLAIATPTAQAAAQAITDIPILITAVTEPAEAGLVDSWEAPGGNITGTSDLNAVEEQLSLVKELAPDAKTVGVVYSSGEVNSQVQVDLAEAAAKKLGLTLKLTTITASGEVQQAANSLDVDAFYVPTDNNVVSALDALVQVAEAKQVPVIVGEGDSVANGGVATYGFDYEQLGYQTGLMAVKILKDGADPAEMAIEKPTDLQLYLNPAAAERMGVTIPQKLLDSADVVVKE
ncbi:ABC transporter substrate-binding protein [Georgenia ruanii]|uniref:Sugar ABC transporter substrate-binding protein n=1 Tax=Georgenia ruanii TaxID=348442 RepID=A0A7J9UTF3_9MICO|nr:ABC transporter substrate-binding protein [Georgenia ruanii]MPV87603.1 sugar ABC transporter substrate-binding protein [Georgenia ruanii]